jgi:dCTP deaminase
MILKTDQIASRMYPTSEEHRLDPLVIVPPSLREDELRNKGVASIDLRLGTWFTSMRQHKIAVLDVRNQQKVEKRRTELMKLADEFKLPPESIDRFQKMLPNSTRASERVQTKMHYIPFGSEFILHPNSFVMAVTLEWIRLPRTLAAYVIGKSSWGRRGLIIATAAGVHPAFTGCLTLELSNVGVVPIAVQPGMTIAQLFLHKVESESQQVSKSTFSCTRRPILGDITPDAFATALAFAKEH